MIRIPKAAVMPVRNPGENIATPPGADPAVAGARSAARRRKRGPAGTADPDPRARFSSEEWHRMVAVAAYFRAECRGFHGGDPVTDWLEAEAALVTHLNAQDRGERSGPSVENPSALAPMAATRGDGI
jgi:hypothetical protein